MTLEDGKQGLREGRARTGGRDLAPCPSLCCPLRPSSPTPAICGRCRWMPWQRSFARALSKNAQKIRHLAGHVPWCTEATPTHPRSCMDRPVSAVMLLGHRTHAREGCWGQGTWLQFQPRSLRPWSRASWGPPMAFLWEPCLRALGFGFIQTSKNSTEF